MFCTGGSDEFSERNQEILEVISQKSGHRGDDGWRSEGAGNQGRARSRHVQGARSLPL